MHIFLAALTTSYIVRLNHITTDQHIHMNPRRIDGIRRDTTIPQTLRLPIIPPPPGLRRTISVGRIWALLLLACTLFWVAAVTFVSLAR